MLCSLLKKNEWYSRIAMQYGKNKGNSENELKNPRNKTL